MAHRKCTAGAGASTSKSMSDPSMAGENGLRPGQSQQLERLHTQEPQPGASCMHAAGVGQDFKTPGPGCIGRKGRVVVVQSPPALFLTCQPEGRERRGDCKSAGRWTCEMPIYAMKAHVENTCSEICTSWVRQGVTGTARTSLSHDVPASKLTHGMQQLAESQSLYCSNTMGVTRFGWADWVFLAVRRLSGKFECPEKRDTCRVARYVG